MNAPLSRSLGLQQCAPLLFAAFLGASAVAAQDDAPAPASQPAAPSPAAGASSNDGAPTSQPAAPAGKPKVIYRGSLSREQIEGTLKTVKSQVRFCYEKRLLKNPELKGAVLVRFVIAGTGAVESAVPTPDPGMEEVASCTTRVVQRLKFPAPRGGGKVIVNYPYRFSPKEKTAEPSGDAADKPPPSSSDAQGEAEGSLPPPDAQPPQAEEPSYFSKCCGCLP